MAWPRMAGCLADLKMAILEVAGASVAYIHVA
jgi:hypothetical protein